MKRFEAAIGFQHDLTRLRALSFSCPPDGSMASMWRETNIENKTETLPVRYALQADLSYVGDMRCAFVVRLGPQTKPSEEQFEGWVEEVDTGKELRFRSNHELLKFLGERFEAVLAMEPGRGTTP
jgi:hypothetical protein